MTAAPGSATDLAADLARFTFDPLSHALYAYRWGKGELRGWKGPDDWQREFLRDLGREMRKRAFDGVHAVEPILMATASGHDIGKSALVAMIVTFLQDCWPYSRGVVTANTSTQLESKTWAEVAKWRRRSITRDWFDVSTGKGSMKSLSKQFPDTWRCDAQTCREENSESFSGLHAANSIPFMIFDEASAIPNAIWTAAEGTLLDGMPLWLVFGNPTRNSGRFHEAFHRLKHRWKRRQIDSRTTRISNKEQIRRWVEDYGEDSDFVRVRVKGQFPRASSLQFIDQETVGEARRREPELLADDPLVMGVDIARGGDDRSVIQFRRGRCARAFPNVVPPRLVIPGEETRDSMRLVSRVTDLVRRYRPAAVFVDGTGVGGPIVDRIRQLGFGVVEVQFGGAPPDKRYKNMRAWMWMKTREWLAAGGAIEDDPDLEEDLCGPEFHHDAQDRLVLESKESMKARGLASPDLADALALTFAAPVAPRSLEAPSGVRQQQLDENPLDAQGSGWDRNPLDLP